MARPCKHLELSKASYQSLKRLKNSGNTPQKIVSRAQVVLLSATGKSSEEISEEIGYSRNYVYRWLNRFENFGIAGLEDQKKPGRPQKMSASKAEEILRLTVERIPHESTHWSVRLMAKYAGVSPRQVRRVWAAADLKPHRLKSFKISQDPLFAEKVRDVVGLYLAPPVNAVVLSVDEKTQIQALDRTQPKLPLRPGQVERRSHDYKRNGTRSLYAAFDVATGKVLGRVTRKHRAKEFLAFLNQIKLSIDPGIEIHLILDNSSTHKTKEVRQWLLRNPRFHFHFTPTSASWLNAVESWFSQLERRSLHRGCFTNVTELRNEIHRYIKVHNSDSAKPFKWTKDAQVLIESHSKLSNGF